MSNYRDYRLTIELLSPLRTPMQSDTLFGHLCWQVLYREGDEGVDAFLEPFRAGEPPFVLSDAFPAGLMPSPLLPSRVLDAPRAKTHEEYAALKKRRKAPFVREADFLVLLRGEEPQGEPVGNVWEIVSQPHAAISRATFTTGSREDEGGALYFTEGRALAAGAGSQRLHIYLRALPDAAGLVEDLFRSMSAMGFGKDKSTGAGAFAVLGMEEYEGFRAVSSPEGFVSLSTYIPAAGDPTEGLWKCRVKRGYLGEMRSPDAPGNPNPYKRPFMMFEPGAYFRTGGAPGPFYGRLVEGIAPGFAKAAQCGYTLAAPCRGAAGD